ncbi:hypothetical protein [Bacillus sp. AFS017336]|uniref:hypothetical protein n=1 Tax=Bacillus sp. AFS017336 TaxID=2033489 RepID=UPI0015CF0F3B|nr:hypothetical protein [Bacillus sp. AFS017336]
MNFNENSGTTHIRISKKAKAKLQEMAKDNFRSMTWQLEKMVNDAYQEMKKEKGE